VFVCKQKIDFGTEKKNLVQICSKKRQSHFKLKSPAYNYSQPAVKNEVRLFLVKTPKQKQFGEFQNILEKKLFFLLAFKLNRMNRKTLRQIVEIFFSVKT
jgi:hypothetical protein